VLDASATAAGRLGVLEDALSQAQRVRGLPVQNYGTSPEDRVVFWRDLHNIAGVRPDFASAGVFTDDDV
jgi:hypothetical protein